ncbi:hypothetical protein BACCIP111883_01090 [Sutcliffiella rhizosphaerae]|uniref:Uncharacterized protein n=1 Tax=Sutcliffiella rhizosphaerae TaxID=2880967 RepID=A0ABM8YKQ5_9BACI|nr:hypothetical protein BACCIP111883_01090 [Sutcliffiella rhizosphaerae]
MAVVHKEKKTPYSITSIGGFLKINKLKRSVGALLFSII